MDCGERGSHGRDVTPLPQDISRKTEQSYLLRIFFFLK